jgi:hypothetical protein
MERIRNRSSLIFMRLADAVFGILVGGGLVSVLLGAAVEPFQAIAMTALISVWLLIRIA